MYLASGHFPSQRPVRLYSSATETVQETKSQALQMLRTSLLPCRRACPGRTPPPSLYLNTTSTYSLQQTGRHIHTHTQTYIPSALHEFFTPPDCQHASVAHMSSLAVLSVFFSSLSLLLPPAPRLLPHPGCFLLPRTMQPIMPPRSTPVSLFMYSKAMWHDRSLYTSFRFEFDGCEPAYLHDSRLGSSLLVSPVRARSASTP